MDTIDIITIVIAGVSAVFAFISLMYSHRQAKKAKFDFLFENLKPITSFINDAFIIVDSKRNQPLDYVKNAEKELLVGFHRIHAYGESYNYKLLKQFGDIHPNDVGECKKSFAYMFLKLEDDYMNFRESKLKENSGELSIKDINVFKDYIIQFNKFLSLACNNAFKFFFSKAALKNSKIEYYAKLEEYGDKYL